MSVSLAHVHTRVITPCSHCLLRGISQRRVLVQHGCTTVPPSTYVIYGLLEPSMLIRTNALLEGLWKSYMYNFYTVRLGSSKTIQADALFRLIMSTVSPNTNTPRSRQQPGLACDECRRRKLRCDRAQPQCGVCRDTDTTCVTTTTRQPRGPRKGHLRALQSRIGKFAPDDVQFH